VLLEFAKKSPVPLLFRSIANLIVLLDFAQFLEFLIFGISHRFTTRGGETKCFLLCVGRCVDEHVVTCVCTW
jgi:hypothetical protein